VVRGGAFDRYDWRVRAAFRLRLRPGYRDWNVGFRVVVSPFFSD
jgi:formylglycine-generating enzyme required for sulfatase activity